MKLLMLICGAVLAGCTHNDAAPPTQPTTAMASAETGPAVDPTIPSWAPRACTGYHAAVVKILACEAVPRHRRDEVRTKYETDQAKWQSMSDEQQAALDDVLASCRADWQSVRNEMTGKCR